MSTRTVELIAKKVYSNGRKLYDAPWSELHPTMRELYLAMVRAGIEHGKRKSVRDG